MSKQKTNPYQKKLSRRELFQSLVGRGKRRDAVSPSSSAAEANGDSPKNAQDMSEAATGYRKYLEAHPDHVPTRCRLVIALYETGRLEEAGEELQTMLESRKAVSFARLYQGLVLARQGNREAALNAWKHYFNIDQPLIQRAVNLLLGREEIGETTPLEAMVVEVEEAIRAQERADQA